MKNQDLVFIQNQIGYRFRNPDLLVQAFTRRSYSAENGGEDNEVLEFIGDKALDLAVVKLLAEKYGYVEGQHKVSQPYGYYVGGVIPQPSGEYVCRYREHKLTELKKRLVNKETLAGRVDALGIAEYLIVGRGDTKSGAWNSVSAKEDLFEAILGAVALDCNWKLEEIQQCAEYMLNPDAILETDEINYTAEIQEWYQEKYGRLPNFEFYSLTGTFTNVYNCILRVPDVYFPYQGTGNSRSAARENVCQKVYEYLDSHGLLYSIRDEIDDPCEEKAINQLETLARRGYFSLPEYSFKGLRNEDGEPLWRCDCSIREEEVYYWAEASSKKAAKKKAAYGMLCHVLGI